MLWILIHTHRHGVDVYPVETANERDLPRMAHVIEEGGSDFEPERDDESAEWAGPWRGWRKEEA